MDEEQRLSSPIAGGLRGIRRSVSSSIFTGRAVPPPAQPDPQTTSLLSQNSLSLTNVSAQLSSISAQIGQLNGSLETIKQNLAISDQLDRQREAAKQKREAILAEQGLREGKESELERKIQTALLSPVRRVATFARGILSRLGEFLFILTAGWLTDKVLSFIRLSSEGNIDALNKFKRKFLFDLAILGGIGLTLTVGLAKLVGTVGSIAGLALKFAFSTLLVAPFKAALNFIAFNIKNFRKNFLKYARQLVTKGPLKLIGGMTAPLAGLGGALLFPKQIKNFFKSAFGKKIVTGASKEAIEGGAKTGAKGILKKVPYLGVVLETIGGYFDFKKRKKDGQTTKEAGMGVGGGIIGGLGVTLAGMLIAPELFSSLIGGIGLAVMSIFGFNAGEIIGDTLSGLKGKQKEDPNYGTDSSGQPNYGAVEKRADGGPVTEGKPYIVGEKGQELFTPDVSGMITPINFKKDSKVSDLIASFDQSAEVTVIPLNASEKGMPASATMAKSSKTPSDSLPNIPSSDFANNFIGFSESMYNVVV